MKHKNNNAMQSLIGAFLQLWAPLIRACLRKEEDSPELMHYGFRTEIVPVQLQT
jgi:hypothetical protein